MLIEVTITNPLTSRLMNFALTVPDGFPSEKIENLHETFKAFNPDCHVNFDWHNGQHHNFICGMPVNMKLDQNRLPFNEFFAKWYCKTNFADMAKETAKQAEGTSNTIIDNIFNQIHNN